jgi:hypothetical protein
MMSAGGTPEKFRELTQIKAFQMAWPTIKVCGKTVIVGMP